MPVTIREPLLEVTKPCFGFILHPSSDKKAYSNACCLFALRTQSLQAQSLPDQSYLSALICIEIVQDCVIDVQEDPLSELAYNQY